MTDLLDKGFSAAYFFLFITLKISYHSFLACQVSVDRSVMSLISLPFYVRACLSLSAFRIFSLSLYFASFTMICHAEDRVKKIEDRREFSLSLGFQCLFPSPVQGSSQLLFLQVHLQHLFLSFPPLEYQLYSDYFSLVHHLVL